MATTHLHAKQVATDKLFHQSFVLLLLPKGFDRYSMQQVICTMHVAQAAATQTAAACCTSLMTGHLSYTSCQKSPVAAMDCKPVPLSIPLQLQHMTAIPTSLSFSGLRSFLDRQAVL
jgi:hypothetical protein